MSSLEALSLSGRALDGAESRKLSPLLRCEAFEGLADSSQLVGHVRAARAFGLVTDAEIVQLIPARSLEGPG